MSRDFKDLVQPMQPLVNQLIAAASKVLPDWDMFLTSTFRSFKEQTDLYNQGRTTKGNIVTNAKAGESFHNVRRAADFAFKPKGKTGPASFNAAMYDLVGKNVKIPGLEWGGSWSSFPDKPHFQYTYCDKHKKNHQYATNFNEEGSCKL